MGTIQSAFSNCKLPQICKTLKLSCFIAPGDTDGWMDQFLIFETDVCTYMYSHVARFDFECRKQKTLKLVRLWSTEIYKNVFGITSSKSAIMYRS